MRLNPVSPRISPLSQRDACDILRTMQAVEDILVTLRQRGYRTTQTRRAVISLLLRARQPLGALDIYDALGKRSGGKDKVTVYRELAVLEKEGILQGTQFVDGVKRYCLRSMGHHHHLVCLRCRRIQDVEMEHDLDMLEKKISRDKSFTVQSHTLEFYGLCARCKQ